MIVSSLLFFLWPCRKRETGIFAWFFSFKRATEKSLVCYDMIDMGKGQGSSKARFCLPESRPNFLDKSEERPEASGKMDGISLEGRDTWTCCLHSHSPRRDHGISRKLNVERTCTLLLGRVSSSGKKWLCGWAEETHMSNRPPCVPGAMELEQWFTGPQKQLREGMKLQGTT